MLYTYTHVFVCFLLFAKLSDTCVTVAIEVIYPHSYPNPLIPSVPLLCNMYIHHHPVLMPNLVLQKSELYNDMHV